MHSNKNNGSGLIPLKEVIEKNFNLGKEIIQGLPTIDSVISNLKQRILVIKEALVKAQGVDEEIIFEQELDRAKNLLKEIETVFMKQNYPSELVVTNTHAGLELKAIQWRRSINEKMERLDKVSRADIDNYNEATYKYNLFCSVVESLY